MKNKHGHNFKNSEQVFPLNSLRYTTAPSIGTPIAGGVPQDFLYTQLDRYIRKYQAYIYVGGALSATWNTASACPKKKVSLAVSKLQYFHEKDDLQDRDRHLNSPDAATGVESLLKRVTRHILRKLQIHFPEDVPGWHEMQASTWSARVVGVASEQANGACQLRGGR
ncbi:hypothetical protein EVAR_89102_1 [Eumeta japonica]|uniref:Uncharacterized protein n=1 Tax=Eumeta variegata TaxID=151549 RepID=A0A4C1XFH6_EUMVA|nr:hypothetical protein EVAR_89102_1 [Eumeta japonica]